MCLRSHSIRKIRDTCSTVLAEIIRDSKKYINIFFRDRELLGSQIIRYVCIRTYMCAQVRVHNSPHTRVYRCKGDGCSRDVSRATTTLWSRRSRAKRLNRQSSQARRQGGFHVARNPPPPPFALVVRLKLISYVMSYFEFHMHRQIRRVDGTDTRINL